MHVPAKKITSFKKAMKVLAVSFVVSFVVFLFLNVFENYFNFLIGKGATELEAPTRREAFRMAVVLVLFAVLQGVLTYAGELEFS
jgi:hypothetical protein